MENKTLNQKTLAVLGPLARFLKCLFKGGVTKRSDSALPLGKNQENTDAEPLPWPGQFRKKRLQPPATLSRTVSAGVPAPAREFQFDLCARHR